MCIGMYYTQMYYTCSGERCTCWWSDSVLFEVNSQEDGSVCCVFIGTMIHINNLARLPYSPFILFSSLPFDIPLCFHSQREHIMPRKRERNIKWASGNKPFIPISEKPNGAAARQQCMDNSIQELHICTYTCIGMPAHKRSFTHTEGITHTNRNSQSEEILTLYTTLII